MAAADCGLWTVDCDWQGESFTEMRKSQEKRTGRPVYEYVNVKEKMKFSLQENVPLIFTYNDLNQRFWCFVSFLVPGTSSNRNVADSGRWVCGRGLTRGQ